MMLIYSKSVYFQVPFLLFSNRRELKCIDGVQQISLEDALSSQEVDVAYICSENTSHEDYIRWVSMQAVLALHGSAGL